MNEMIDRVADALIEAFQNRVATSAGMPFSETGVSVPSRELFQLWAQTAIEAMREPTDEMFTVGSNRLDDDGNYNAEDVWFGMIDAALINSRQPEKEKES